MGENETDQNEPVGNIQKSTDILLNTFTIKNRRYRVLFNIDHILWALLDSKHGNLEQTNSSQGETPDIQNAHTKFLPLNNIIRIRKGKTKGDSLKVDREREDVPTNQPPSDIYLSIWYAKRLCKKIKDFNRWKLRVITFQTTDVYILQKWHNLLQMKVSEIERPKSLLFFINPFSGRKNTLQLYKKHCEFLFHLAGIEITLIISQRPNQIKDILLSHDLSTYDGICCVGGDGTVSEVVNGLLFRCINDMELDILNPSYIPKPKLPIGIIPGGSTDTIAYSIHGSSDVETAALHIVMGKRRGLDICSVYNHVGLTKFYTSVLSYGFLGDTIRESEKYRWLGPKRYEFAGMKAFLANKSYDLTLIVPKNTLTTNEIKNACVVDCGECKRMSDIKLNSSEVVTDIFENSMACKELSGKYFMFMSTNISCSCLRSPNGISPHSHLGDGYIDLILVRKTSLFEKLQFLFKTMQRNGDIRKLPFVESYRTTMFKFQADANNELENNESSITGSCQPITPALDTNNITGKKISSWNCDGEIIYDLDLTVISHCQIIDVFMRGPYTPHTKPNKTWINCCNSQQD